MNSTQSNSHADDADARGNGEELDPKALSIIDDILNRVRRSESGGCLGAQDHWLYGSLPQNLNEEISISYRIQLDHNPVRAKVDQKASKQIEAVAVSLKLALDALQKMQGCLARQVRNCEAQASAIRLRAGLSAVPDEILALILEYSVGVRTGIENRRTALYNVLAALKISAVCQRFRHTAIRTSSLWCSVSNEMGARLLLTLCGRITKPSADIIFEASMKNLGTKFTQFIHAITSTSCFWRSFTFKIPKHAQRDSFSKIERESLVLATREIHVPFLAELRIHYPEFVLRQNIPEGDAAFFFSTWRTPRLTSLITTNLVPTPFASANLLTTFKVRLCYSESRNHNYAIENFKSLYRFLKCCLKLEMLTVELHCLWGWTNDSATRDIFYFPSVYSLELFLYRCDEDPIKYLLDTACFPNVSSLTLGLASFLVPVQDVLAVVLQDNNYFTSLHGLSLSFNCDSVQKRPVLFPFSKLSSLHHLRLSTGTATIGDASFHARNGPYLPALRSLKFVRCEMLSRRWVSQLLQRFKEQGNEPQITVTDCHWRRKRRARSPNSTGSNTESDEEVLSDLEDSSEAGSVSDISCYMESEPITVEEMLRLI